MADTNEQQTAENQTQVQTDLQKFKAEMFGGESTEQKTKTQKTEQTQQTQEHQEQKEQEKQPAQEQQEVKETPVDWGKISKGKFKSEEDFNNFINNSEQIKLRAESLEKASKEAVNPFEEDADLYKIQQFAKKTGIKDYGFLGNVITADLTTMNPIQILKMKERLTDPDFDEALVDRSLSKDYCTDKDAIALKKFRKEYTELKGYAELEDADKAEVDEIVSDNELKLKREVKKATNEILAKRGEIKLPEKADPEVLKAERLKKIQTRGEEWKSDFAEAAKATNEIEIDVPVSKDNSIKMKIEFADDFAQQKAEITEQMANYLFQQELEHKPEEVQRIKSLFLDGMFVGERRGKTLNYILSEVAKKVRSMSDEEWNKYIHNPSAVKSAEKFAGKELSDLEKEKQKLKTT